MLGGGKVHGGGQRGFARLRDGEVLAVLEAGVELLAHLRVRIRDVLEVLAALVHVHERLRHRDSTRRVQHVNHAARVVGGELDGGVHLAGGGTTDE